jgi:cation:H+ antiporter
MIIAAQIIGGLLLLFVGAEALVRGAVKIAHSFKIPPMLIGLTVIAYGTSTPELLITIKATLKGASDIAIGNVLGSNIANIFLVLGISALIYPIKTNAKLVNFDIRYLFIATIAMMLFFTLGDLNQIEGAFLIVILLTYTYSTFKKGRDKKSDIIRKQVQEVEEQLDLKLNNIVATIAVIMGFVMLAYGADILVIGATALAQDLGVGEAAIAVTIIAIGGSAPELATSIVAALRKHSDIAIGNVVGSNIFNTLAVLGIGSLIAPIQIAQSFLVFDMWVVLVATLSLFVLVKIKKKISRFSGFVFLTLYIFYISWQFIN